MTFTGTATAELGGVQAGAALTSVSSFGPNARRRAGPISRPAVLNAIASPHVEGHQASFSEPAGRPATRIDAFGPMAAANHRYGLIGHASRGTMSAPRDGTLDPSALALFGPTMAVTDALGLSPKPASPSLEDNVSLLDFERDTIFGEVTSFASMKVPAPLLLLLSTIGWLALGARGRAVR